MLQSNGVQQVEGIWFHTMTYYLSPYDNPKPQAPDEGRPFRLVEHYTGDVIETLYLTGREACDLQTQLEHGRLYKKVIDEIASMLK